MSSGTMSQEEYKHHVSAVWKATLILAIVTVLEVTGALIYPHSFPIIVIHLFFIIMSLIKAFYIVGVFMHMKYERQALMLTVLLPTIFLVWAIIAFMWEGGSWLHLRQLWLF